MEQNNITIRLLDGSLIKLTPDQIELYPTIKDQIEYLAPGPENIVDINYPNPKSLYQLLTNPNEALPFDSFLHMIEAADYIGNDDILNNLLVQMANTFTDKSFKTATTEIQESMIDLVYKLPDTVIHRFRQLIQTIKLDYEIITDSTLRVDNYTFSDDLNSSLLIKFSFREVAHLVTGIVFTKDRFTNTFRAKTEFAEYNPVLFYLDNSGNVYGIIISPELQLDNMDDPFVEKIGVDENVVIEDTYAWLQLVTYNKNKDYESKLLLENNLVVKLSQGTQRYALISNLEENEENPYAHFSIVHRTDNQSLATFDLPRGKYKQYKISGTQFPGVSPKMKIVIWRMPEDITNSRYRITAIDVPQKPTFFIDNIDFLSIPPTIFKNWPIDQGYVLFNSEEDKLLLVRKTMDGHNVSLMTDKGILLMEHLFIADIPIFLVKDMIITVSDQLEDIEWGGKIPDETVIDTNTRLKIWYTQNMTKPIPVYDNTFVPEVDGHIPWSIGDVYTGTKDSILLTLVYRKIDDDDDEIFKYTFRKYTIKSYENMPEFFEDRL